MASAPLDLSKLGGANDQGPGRKGAEMLIIGCDYHPSVQQIAWVNTETGECDERRLMHSDGEAERFYRERKQRNDQRDAKHILKLLMEDRFPKIWRPIPENRDVRQLLLHRHRLVGMRTRVMNQLQAIAMNEGVRRKSGLWSKKGRARWSRSYWLPGPVGAGKSYWSCWI